MSTKIYTDLDFVGNSQLLNLPLNFTESLKIITIIPSKIKQYILTHNKGTKSLVITVIEDKINGLVLYPKIYIIDDNSLKITFTKNTTTPIIITII